MQKANMWWHFDEQPQLALSTHQMHINVSAPYSRTPAIENEQIIKNIKTIRGYVRKNELGQCQFGFVGSLWIIIWKLPLVPKKITGLNNLDFCMKLCLTCKPKSNFSLEAIWALQALLNQKWELMIEKWIHCYFVSFRQRSWRSIPFCVLALCVNQILKTW